MWTQFLRVHIVTTVMQSDRRTRRLKVAIVMVMAIHGYLVSSAHAQDHALITASSNQDWPAVMELVQQGSDPNVARADGVTALLLASHWEQVEIARQLISAGADVNATDDHGVSPLERAAQNANTNLVGVLIEAGANPNAALTSGLTPLMVAARTGNLDVVRLLLDNGADVNAVAIETQSTALMWAVAETHKDIVRLLLARSADPRQSTIKGFTPLMYAAQNGDIEIAEALLAAGVDLNERSNDDTHVLPFAIVSNQDTFALFLLKHGADPNGTINGIPALHAAAGNVGVWLGDWYRRHGRGGLYARFRRASLSGGQRLPLVEALLAKGANPNGRISSSAMIMSYIGYPKKGAFEPFACGTGDLLGATPLWVAAYDMNGAGGQVFSVGESRTSTSTDTLLALLNAGADQHLTTADGTTPFMAAAGLGRATYTPREPRGVRSPSAEAAVKVLLEAGADINATNEADFSALHGASFRGLNEVVEFLVAEGADINARDFRGRTAYRLAQGSKQSFQFQTWPDTAELLERLGANTDLGIPGTIQERLRDIPLDATEQP